MARPMWLTSRVILNKLNARRNQKLQINRSVESVVATVWYVVTAILRYVFCFCRCRRQQQNISRNVCACASGGLGHTQCVLTVLFVCVYINTHSSNTFNLLVLHLKARCWNEGIPNCNEVVHFVDNINCGHRDNVTMEKVCAYCPLWTRI